MIRFKAMARWLAPPDRITSGASDKKTRVLGSRGGKAFGFPVSPHAYVSD
jgi:hypothetical protein